MSSSTWVIFRFWFPSVSSRFPSLLFTMAGWTSLASQFPNCSVIQLSSARMEQRLAHQTQISNFFRVPTFLPNTDRRLKSAVASIRGPYETAAAAFVGPISLNSALSALDGLFTEILVGALISLSSDLSNDLFR
ncbi:hypothetical protein BDZ89DRAFT_1126958 [Hymenopellis radicata]|nr:hypothetical protein BDZ89DRAFT_1126958 [Hymenopellis radicata]